MMVTMDLEEEPIPLVSRLWCFILFQLIILCYAQQMLVLRLSMIIMILGEEELGHSPFIREFNNSHLGHESIIAQIS